MQGAGGDARGAPGPGPGQPRWRQRRRVRGPGPLPATRGLAGASSASGAQLSSQDALEPRRRRAATPPLPAHRRLRALHTRPPHATRLCTPPPPPPRRVPGPATPPAQRGSQRPAATVGRPRGGCGRGRPGRGGLKGRVANSSGSDKSISSSLGAARYKALGAGRRACARRTRGGQPGRLGERRRRRRGARARSAPPRTVSDPGPGGGGGGRGAGPERRSLPCAPRPRAGGSPARVCVGLAPLFFIFIFCVAGFLIFRLALRWVRWFLGDLSVAPGEGVRLVRAQPGERASLAPAEKSALPGAGAGTAAPGGVPLYASQLEPWLAAAAKAPSPWTRAAPRAPKFPHRLQTTLLFAEVCVRHPRDADAQRRVPRLLDRPGRSRCG